MKNDGKTMAAGDKFWYFFAAHIIHRIIHYAAFVRLVQTIMSAFRLKTILIILIWLLLIYLHKPNWILAKRTVKNKSAWCQWKKAIKIFATYKQYLLNMLIEGYSIEMLYIFMKRKRIRTNLLMARHCLLKTIWPVRTI